MKNIIPVALITALLAISCSSNQVEPDAWGNFEATEILISSEVAGKILTFPVSEGEVLLRGDKIAIVDTTLISMQIVELEATKNTVITRGKMIDSQNEILIQQINNIDVNISRINNMLKDEAATQKQLDDLTGQVAVLKKQILANNSQKSLIRSELAVIDSKRDQLSEKIRRCSIDSPSDGTIIEKYSEKGEITAPGKPLLKIADLKTMRLKVYISGIQLGEVIIGSKCKVRIDNIEDEYREYEGTIITVSDKAEFTPKIIQTKEERVSLVYAVTIEVENDGRIKSGMPGEAIFSFTE